MVVTTRGNRFQVDPTAMQRAGGTTVRFRRFPQASHLTLQVCCEARALLGIFGKKRFQLRIFHAISGLLKTFLAIFEGFDQVIDNRYNFLLFFRTNLVARRCLRACLDCQF